MDEITSVALFIPSATNAEERKKKPAPNFKSVSSRYENILSLAPCSAFFNFSKIELFI